KKLRYFATPKELNPALGWRGIRVSLEWRDLFLMQVSALVRARSRGDVRILLPMVTTLEELRQARALVEEVQAQAKGNPQRVPLGIMIEVPAAAMALRDLVLEADFLSVGTNDLVQYLFAVDRDNAWVSSLYQTYHPAHLRVLRYIARICNLAGKPVAVCGEMAGEAAGALFLVGAGFRCLSMAPPFVPEIKGLLRQAPLSELERLASRAALCATGEEARGLLDAAVERYWKRAVHCARQAAPGGA
ncbi:MAG: putative PEP-binding protein, partial [Planctomycetota bacterium]